MRFKEARQDSVESLVECEESSMRLNGMASFIDKHKDRDRDRDRDGQRRREMQTDAQTKTKR